MLISRWVSFEGTMKMRFYRFDVSLPESSEVWSVWWVKMSLNKALCEFWDNNLVDSLAELLVPQI